MMSSAQSQSRASTARRPAVTSTASQRELVALSLLLCGGAA